MGGSQDRPGPRSRTAWPRSRTISRGAPVVGGEGQPFGLRAIRALTIALTAGEILAYFLLLGVQERWGWPITSLERMVSESLILVGLGCLAVGIASVVVGFVRSLRERPGGPLLILLGVISIVIGLLGISVGALDRAEGPWFK